MPEREHQRLPYSVQVEFRTASAFLVTYSLNLSRGGLFIETDVEVPVGAEITLSFAVPGSDNITISGVVAWRRGRESSDGPPGLGIQFQDVSASIGNIIDRLVAAYEGVSVLIYSHDKQDRTSLSRMTRMILSTAELVIAADASVAHTMLSDDVDLAIVDVDAEPEGAIALLRAASSAAKPVPSVALASSKKLRERARGAGASEVASNPPPLAELQLLVMRAIGKPLAVK